MSNSIKPGIRAEIKPFKVAQALVGLEMDENDYSTLRYFDFLSRHLTIEAAHFIHVLPLFDLQYAMYQKETEALIGNYTISEDMVVRMKEEVGATLISNQKTHKEYDVAEGNPLEEMVNRAKSLNSDLIIIGQDKERTNHGIFAKNMARSTTANALIIPQDAPAEITNILVPIDFSESSIEALETAIAIHKNMDPTCRLVCLNVYCMPGNPHFRGDAQWLRVKDMAEKNINDGFEVFLQNVAGDYRSHIDTALMEQHSTGIANFIVDYANDNNVNFIVMGARGHSKVHLLLMGSVTEGVLDQNKRIPVLVVK